MAFETPADGAAIAAGELAPLQFQVRITGEARLVGQINEEAMAGVLPGLSRSKTREFLKSQPEIESFDIHIMPFWRRIFPLDSSKIKVNVLNP
jgi:hypothetical protein